MEIGNLNVGILFILAVGAISVYGIALAGWSSNNKYSLMGGLRSSAQMISYELPFHAGDRFAAAAGESLELSRRLQIRKQAITST